MTTAELITAITQHLKALEPEPAKAADTAAALRAAINQASPHREHPVDHVTWLPLNQIQPNDYNPNTVARTELALLRRSIEADGITQPIVVVKNPDTHRHEIVDGYHRQHVIASTPAIRNSTHGMAPVVILNKSINDRMASTIRHNRARGKHQLAGMANMVFQMLDNGWSDAEICNELGMEPEELLRVKHVTGFSRLFAEHAYNQAWMTKNQIRARTEYRKSNATEQEETERRADQ